VAAVDVGAGSAGKVGSAPPGAGCGGGDWWGARVAEATTAARTAAVSPKANTSSRQGWRGLARWRGGGVGMVHRPGSTRTSERMGCPCNARPTGRIRRSSAERIERCVLPVNAGWRWWHRQWRQGVGCARAEPPVIRGDWSMERPQPLADDLSRRSPFRAPHEGCNSVHNLASYGRQRPAETPVHTAVTTRSMVRMF